MKDPHIMHGGLRTMVDEHGKDYYCTFTTQREDNKPISFYYGVLIPKGLHEVRKTIQRLSEKSLEEEEKYIGKEFLFSDNGGVYSFSPATIYTLRRLAWMGTKDLFDCMEQNREAVTLLMKGHERIRREAGVLIDNIHPSEGVSHGINYGVFPPSQASKFLSISMIMSDLEIAREHKIKLYTEKQLEEMLSQECVS